MSGVYKHTKGKTMACQHNGKDNCDSELRIVLIGGRELNGESSNKSPTGNIILGKMSFDTSRRTSQSEVKQGVVNGRRVTVVDTPGWWWHYPLENTPELDKIEVQNSVHLCPPGPNAFLLVIPVGIMFCQVFKPSLEEHLKLFNKDIVKHTIVLFSVDYPCSESSLKHEVNRWPALRWILRQCGDRQHILDVTNSQDSTQVITLFQKIDAMIAENADKRYLIDEITGKALKEKIQTLTEKASMRRAKMQSQRKQLRSLIDGGKTPPAHLRLVMVGAQWSAKSSAGNTILKKDAFNVYPRRTTEYSEVSHSVVSNRRLTVVDSPGWFYNHTLSDTCEMDVFEIKNSVNMCAPGPHAILLAVGLSSAFNASNQKALQEHMSLFSEDVWKHTIVLFTRGDWLGSKTVEERIESEKGLVWLVEKCENRYHVLNNEISDEKQVTELLEKIEEMWVGNEQTHYNIDLRQAEQMEAQKKAGKKKAKKIKQVTQRQGRVLSELFREKKVPLNTDFRIVLLGRKQSGKSMAGNRMLLDETFGTAWMKKEFQDQRRDTTAVKHQAAIGGLHVTVVEAPGWSSNTTPTVSVKNEVIHSVSMCAPGPHAFLLVVPISKAYTQSDLVAVGQLLEPFGERVWRHCLVLFTWGDWLNDRPIEEYISRGGQALQRLVEKCTYKYHVLNCNRFSDQFQVIVLFQKIFGIMTRNKSHYVFTEDKLKRQGQAVLTEEEWNRREQELIDRMLRALAQEPDEPTVLPVKAAASIDGAFIPSLSGDVPSEFGSTSWTQREHAKVSEWLNLRVWSSDQTSGVGSMSASASHAENLTDDHQMKNYSENIHAAVFHDRETPDFPRTRRRNSC